MSSVPPRTFGGFGSDATLSVTHAVRLSVQFFDDLRPTAQLSVWALIVPHQAMAFDVLLGRDSWQRFSTHPYTVEPSPPHSPKTGKLQLGHLDDQPGAQAFTPDPDAADTSFKLLYAGDSVVSLSSEPQTLLVNLVRRNGLPALTGQYLVDLLPRDGSECGMFGQEDVFVKKDAKKSH